MAGLGVIENDWCTLSLITHPAQLPDAHARVIDPQLATPEAYLRYGIACPDSVNRAVASRRAEYLAGRLAALKALHEANVSIDDFGIGANRAPIWPAGWIGSITHTRTLAAAVVLPNTQARGVGIDLENIVNESALASIRQSVLTPEEERVLGPLSAQHGEAVAATVGFSAKESFYKAVAATVGQVFDFDALRLSDVQLDSPWLFAEVTQALSPALQPGLRVCLGYSLLPDQQAVLTSCAW